VDAQATTGQRARLEAYQRQHRLGLATLVFTDIVGSTELKERLGEIRAVELIQRHHAVVRELVAEIAQALEIDTAGDSFLLTFLRPSDAVQFALRLLRRLEGLRDAGGGGIQDRIGVHVGEILIEEDNPFAGPKDLHGLQVDLCARIMSLAGPSQILLSRLAFDLARQALRTREVTGLGQLAWLNHGPYQFKGVDEPVEVCEVGEKEIVKAARPASTEKGKRLTDDKEEVVLGWRPSLDTVIPGTEWQLEEKLGEGGFGEVWLGRHQRLKEQHVFKFCFRADRVRSLKREMTLLRLLREKVAGHRGLVRLLDVYLEQPPYYLEFDYVAGRDLAAWCAAQGGVASLPVETRVEIVAQVAEALEAAHQAGIIHRDIKPSNILVSGQWAAAAGERELLLGSSLGTGQSSLVVKLTDFGIGQVVSEEVLAGLTRAGFTQTMLSTPGSRAGTHLYMAPEVVAGKPASAQSDLFSLGVVLYQLLTGDLDRPLTTDWAESVDDPLLRADLKKCFAGNPHDRFKSAGQLAESLRALPRRRAAAQLEQAEITAREKAAYRRGVMRTAAIFGSGLLLALVAAGFAWHQRSRALATLGRLEMQQAEKYLASEDLSNGLAWLAKVVRQEPGNRAAAERLMSVLSQRNLPTPVAQWAAPRGQSYYSEVTSQAGRVVLLVHAREAGLLAWRPKPTPARLMLIDTISGRVLRDREMPTDRRFVRASADGRSLMVLWMANPPSGGATQVIGGESWDMTTGRDLAPALNFAAPYDDYLPGRDHVFLRGNDGRNLMLSVRTGRAIDAPPGGGWTGFMAFLGDDRWYVKNCDASAGKVQGHVGNYDVTSTRARVQLRDLATGNPAGPVLEVANGFFGGDAEHPLFLAGADMPRFEVLDLRTGQRTSTANDHPVRSGRWSRWNAPCSLSISPDGGRILVRSRIEQNSPAVWLQQYDLHTGNRTWPPMKENGNVQVSWSADGLRFGSGRLHDALTGASLGPNLAREISVGGGWVTFWDARESWVLPTVVRTPRPPLQSRFSPDDGMFWALLDDGSKVAWATRTGLPSGNSMPADWSAAALQSAQGAAAWKLFREGTRVHVVNEGRNLAMPSLEHPQTVTAAGFNHDGSRIVTAAEDGVVRVWQSDGGELVHQQPPCRAEVLSMAPSADDRWLVAASSDNALTLWELPRASGRAPSWLAGLAEGCASGGGSRILQIRQQVLASKATDDFTRWGKWFFADHGTRTISPNSRTTIPEHVQRLAAGNTLEGLKLAVRLQPTNGLALARLARALVTVPLAEVLGTNAFSASIAGASNSPPPWLFSEANWLRRLARTNGCLERELVWTEAVLAGAGGDRAASLRGLRQVADTGETDLAFWREWSNALVDAGQWAEALTALRRLIALASAPGSLNPSAESAAHFQCAAILRGQGRETEAIQEALLARDLKPRDPRAEPRTLDLSPYFNANPSGLEYSLSRLCQGPREVKGVPFDLRGVIQAAHTSPHPAAAGFPEAIAGIAVGRKCRKLDFLHGTLSRRSTGEPVARYVVHFADAQTATIPLLYGPDVTEVRVADHEFVPRGTGRQATVVLAKVEAPPGVAYTDADLLGSQTRIYLKTWTNPRPEVEIATVEFIAEQYSAPFLLGITAE
jgi:class 3 adenylate cyclase/WD40 repeat protein/tetratricopeptide (TPR) repeat protein